jgi:putative membrane protein
MNFLSLFFKGMAIGGANVMPGVSGATLAVIFRIYDKKIESINNLFSKTKESLKFLIPVMCGVAIGILTVGRGLNFLLGSFSLQMGGFIAGLMAGSLPFIHSQAVLKAEKKATIKYYFIAALGASVIILLALFSDTDPTPAAANVTFNMGLAAHLFFGGVFAAAVMVIPGISGAMVLVLFGLYALAIDTLSLIPQYLMSPTDLNLLGAILMVVIPLGLGIASGILLGSKIIALLLKKFHSATYFAILGLVFGTIFAIFNDDATYQSHEAITAPIIVFTVITFVLGTTVSLFLGKKKD